MEILKLIESYQLNLEKFQRKGEKISPKLKEKIKIFIKQNKDPSMVLVETFGSFGYKAFVYKKRLHKYI